jgi:hypothetical protein
VFLAIPEGAIEVRTSENSTRCRPELVPRATNGGDHDSPSRSDSLWMKYGMTIAPVAAICGVDAREIAELLGEA